MTKIRIQDPGWKKFGYGIRDEHPGSATLLKTEDSSKVAPRRSELPSARVRKIRLNVYICTNIADSVVDPLHDADPDSTGHPDADPDADPDSDFI
jgi:hypothetical protein